MYIHLTSRKSCCKPKRDKALDLKCDDAILDHVLPLILASGQSDGTTFVFSEYINECHDPLKFTKRIGEDQSVSSLAFLITATHLGTADLTCALQTRPRYF